MDRLDLQRVFEGSIEAKLLLDEAGRVVAVTDGYLRAVRDARAQVVGRSVYELPPYLHDAALCSELRDALSTSARGKVVQSNPLPNAKPSASGIRWGWGITRPVTDEAGRVRLYVHSLRSPDTQVQLESERERHLRKLIEHAYDTMALFDSYGRVTFVSASVERLLGYSEAEFMRRASRDIHPDDIARFGQEIGKLLAHPGGLMLVRFRASHRDGSWRTLECASRNLLHDPDVSAIVANFHDVTPHIQLEAELRRTNQRLREASLERERLLEREQEANRTKDEFLAMLGHELRNPLSPIVTALQLMRMRGAGSAQKELTVIERQVRHLTRLIDDLLDVSRITRGKIELRKRRVELSEVVSKAIEMTSPLLEKRQQVLRARVPATGLTVYGDDTRLAQVVANLLENAAKYTPLRGQIDISGRRENGSVVLQVADTGRGIAPELLPRLFEQFVQGVRTTDRSEGGLGLGLAIVRSLIELHGGTVSAASAGLGKGSQFTVRLPLASATDSAEAPGPMRPGAASADRKDSGRRRVLVVDDNRDAAELLAQALESSGYSVSVAFDGPDALSIAAEQRPELAFLDIGLPVMDGYELAQRMRALPESSGTKLVAITGYGQASDRARSASAGFAEHLVKPVDLERILDVSARLLPRAPPGPPRDQRGAAPRSH